MENLSHRLQVLGRTAREGGDLQEALEHYGAVLACGGAPGTWQASRLRTFLDTVQQASLEKVGSAGGCLGFKVYG